MLYFSKFKIFLVSIISLLFIYIASSNFTKFDDAFFNKIPVENIVYEENIPLKLYIPIDENICQISNKHSKYSTLKIKETIFNRALYYNDGEDNPLNKIKEKYEEGLIIPPSEYINEMYTNDNYKCRDYSNNYQNNCEIDTNSEICCFSEKDKCINFNCDEYGFLSRPNSEILDCYGENCDIYDINNCCYEKSKCSSMFCGDNMGV